MNAFFLALAVMLAQADTTPEPGAGGVARPQWIALAKESGLPLHWEAIESELWATPEEARTDVLVRAAGRAQAFAAEVAPRIRTNWIVPGWLVEGHLLREPVYVEEVDWTYGPMYRAHVLLELSPEKRELLLSKWHETVIHRRLGQVGGALGFILVCVATLLAYLRLDDATRGYYSGWLLAGATAVVAGSAAVLYSWVA